MYLTDFLEYLANYLEYLADYLEYLVDYLVSLDGYLKFHMIRLPPRPVSSYKMFEAVQVQVKSSTRLNTKCF